MSDHKLFEYSLTDAWGIPLSSVTIHSEDSCRVTYGLFERFRPNIDALHSIVISGDSMKRIKEVLSNDRLYEIDEFEYPFVLDGFMHEFYISDGKRVHRIEGDNFAYCINDRDKYPNINTYNDMLNAIASILITEGIPEACFSLEIE